MAIAGTASVKDIVRDIIEKPARLSPEQQAAVVSDARYNRVVAGAGTGKTEVLTRRIVYQLLVKQIPPSAMVAFTFTERAAKNMKSRIYDRVESIAGEKALTNLGEMYVGTIHSYAKHILEKSFGFGNYQVFDENQETAYLFRIGWGLGLGEDRHRPYSRSCADFLRCVNMVWGEMIDPRVLKERAHLFYEKFHRYEAILSENRILTFGKMIHSLAERARNRPEALNYVKSLLVDEYQDINNAQQDIIETVGRYAEVFAVGDPRQCIYQWRGSNESSFRKFSEIFAGTNQLSLTENRRSVERIVDVANEFAQTLAERYDRLRTVREEEGKVVSVEFETETQEAEWIASAVEGLKRGHGLSYSDFGILLRSVKTSAAPLLAVFRRRGMPFIVGGKIGLFRRPEAQSLGRIFAWLSADGFWYEGDSWNHTEIVTGEDLVNSALQHWEAATAKRIPQGCLDALTSLKQSLGDQESGTQTFNQVYHRILLSLGYGQFNPDDTLDATIMANLGRFNVLLADFETASRLGGRKVNWKADLKGLCWFMNSYASQAYEDQSLDELMSLNAIKVMTVHQAKGLEWPFVFVPALLDKRFPTSMAGRKLEWFDIPRDLFDARRYEGSEDDERKLFYVAITRARDALSLSSSGGTARASNFMAEFNDGTVQPIDPSDPLTGFEVHTTGADEELETFSAREIVNYETCPQMYRFNEVWGYTPGFEHGLGFGENLHFCLQKAGELVTSEGMTPLSAISTAIDEHFHLPFASGYVMESFKRGAKKMLIDYAKKHGSDMASIEEMEYRLEFPMQKANIMGKVDVILRRSGGSEVREYKTSEAARSFEQSAAQVNLYALGLRKVGRDIDSGSVAYLKEAELRPVEITESSLQHVSDRANRTLGRILDRDFKATPGGHCKSCDYAGICRFKAQDNA